jgi:hypothetical protein
VKKYPQYCPDHLLQWIIISCTNGDNQLLEEKLEQLRTIDRLAKYYGPQLLIGSVEGTDAL